MLFSDLRLFYSAEDTEARHSDACGTPDGFPYPPKKILDSFPFRDVLSPFYGAVFELWYSKFMHIEKRKKKEKSEREKDENHGLFQFSLKIHFTG